MYCKYCGKEIADDSRFCQHCGKALDENIEPVINQSKEKKVVEIPTIKTNLSQKAKVWIGLYAGWILLNFLCIFLGGARDNAAKRFFPFERDEMDCYDFTEFLIYAIIIPLAAYGIYKFIQYKKAKNQ